MLSLANPLVHRGNDSPLFLSNGDTITAARFQQLVGAIREQSGTRLAGKRVAIEAHSLLEFCACLYAAWTSSATVVLSPNAIGVANFAPVNCDDVISAKGIANGDGAYGGELTVPPTAEMVLFTSGSSGKPKCLRKSIQQLQAEQVHLQPLIGDAYQGALVGGSVSPQHFYGFVFLVAAPLVHGSIILDRTLAGLGEADDFVHSPRKSVFVSSPATLDRLAEVRCHVSLGGPSVAVISAGGPLLPITRESFLAENSARLIEIYGSSESGVIAHRDAAPGEPWNLLPGVAIEPLDGIGARITSPYADNGSVILADSVAQGRKHGSFSLNGRLDRTVKIEERRLSLTELEDVLRRHPRIADAACCALSPTGASRKVIGAALVQKEDPPGTDPLDLPALERSLRTLLLKHFHITLIPRQWINVAAIPRNAIGKVSQSDVEELFESADPAPSS